MRKEEDSIPGTSYVGDAAHEYDQKRFVDKQGQLFSHLEFQQLKRAVGKLDFSNSILEVGCGTARFSQYLGQEGFSVVGTDPSPDMIDLASRKCAALSTVRFQCEEGGSLSFGDSTFDFVFAIRVTNQTGSEEYALAMIREMIRVTKSGGLILIEFVNRKRPFARQDSSVRLSFDQIDEIAKEQACDVISRSGVLVFSQTVLNRIPGSLVPFWGIVEQSAASILWRWASRGYVLLRRQ